MAECVTEMKRHDCSNDWNKRLVSIEWTTDIKRLVTTWGCKRCLTVWCTIWDPKIEEEKRLEALRARANEACDSWARETNNV